MKCVYANWHDGNQPCCTHDCEGCIWCDDEAEKEYASDKDINVPNKEEGET